MQSGAGDIIKEARTLREKISKARAVVVFSGAGASADSGIPTFRGAGSGWWTGLLGAPILAVLGTGIGWEWSPSWINGPLYRRFFLRTVTEAVPNAFHRVIGRMGNAWVITQNVDGLHQRAGTPAERVAEMHGRVLDDGMCICSKDYPCDTCPGGGKWRPTALLFMDCHGQTQLSCTEGHIMYELRHAQNVLVLVVGLSGQVGSGNCSLRMLRAKKAEIVHVNLCDAETLRTNTFHEDGDVHLQFGAGELFEEIEKQDRAESINSDGEEAAVD